MTARIPIWATAATFLLAATVSAGPLNVGDKAPPLTVSKWVKGEKIDKIENGQVYVVEFWATWCGPCRTSIPHVTELQKKHPEVKFVGVSVWESDPKLVEPFVKEMGDKMGYRVAMDQVKEDDKASEGAMAKDWMAAAEENGIPAAFIVGKDGKIAWIGHPMSMDAPLEKIIAGDFDLSAAASARLAAKQAERKLMAASRKLSTLRGDLAKNHKEIVEEIDKVVAEAPTVEMNFASMKYSALLYGDPKVAADYGSKLVDKMFKDSAMGLNMVAWTILDPAAKFEDSRRDYKLALRAAERANELSKGENYAILDTLALACFKTGNPAKAVEYQEKAVKLAPMKDPELTERLETFRKAAEKK